MESQKVIKGSMKLSTDVRRLPSHLKELSKTCARVALNNYSNYQTLTLTFGLILNIVYLPSSLQDNKVAHLNMYKLVLFLSFM
jgi:hypothetical protein